MTAKVSWQLILGIVKTNWGKNNANQIKEDSVLNDANDKHHRKQIGLKNSPKQFEAKIKAVK